ncbi:MAG: ketopantoate reductase family protein [Oscillospiraceae bacterium]
MEFQTVALIGLGAIGSYLAPALRDTLGENRFFVVASGARRARLERDGITINGETQRFRILDPACDRKPVDLVIVIVKHLQLPQAIEDLRPFVGEHTTIVSFMNGISSEETLGAAFGKEKLLYGLARVSVVMQNHKSSFDPATGYFEFGEAINTAPYTPRVQAMQQLFDRAGLRYFVREDMLRALWLKFCCNVSENQTSALLGLTFEAWKINDHANAVREAAFREAMWIAQKQGIDITEADLAQQKINLQSVPGQNKTSMLQDLEQGRPTEVEMFAGTVCRMGRELGVATPVNEFLYHALYILEDQNTGLLQHGCMAN